MTNGLMFGVNPNLLEMIDQDEVETNPERCFRRGDIVLIRNLSENEMKRIYEKYGVQFNDDILKVSCDLKFAPNGLLTLYTLRDSEQYQPHSPILFAKN